MQVEELYSLDSDSFAALKPIHGLVFLFKWIGNSEIDGAYVNDSRLDDIVFVKQVIENACATQAIISLLLNCSHEDIDLGGNLTEFKQFVSNFDPDTKGLALSNSEVIRQVHNSFARQQMFEIEEKGPSKEEDAYHFVAYLPIKGRLYELDGLKEAPIDLGEIPAGVDWTEVVRPVLEKRMKKYSEGEIHFNLMALVSDRKLLYERELQMLSQISAMDSDEMTFRIKELESLIEDEERKRLTARKENVRRKHNYLPFIIELLQVLAEQGKLTNQVQAITERQKAKKPRLAK